MIEYEALMLHESEERPDAYTEDSIVLRMTAPWSSSTDSSVAENGLTPPL